MVAEVCGKCGELVIAGQEASHYNDVVEIADRLACTVVGCAAPSTFVCHHPDGARTLTCRAGHFTRLNTQRLS